MSEVKRWVALHHPQGSLAGPEMATMVLASDYDALKAENERLRNALRKYRAPDNDAWAPYETTRNRNDA